MEFFRSTIGPGPKTYSIYRFGDRGIVAYEETHGVDYMKNQNNESFGIKGATATGRSSHRTGHESKGKGGFFVGLDDGPAGTFSTRTGLA